MSTPTPYPETKKLVIVRGKGTPRETRIETDITVYLLRVDGRPVLRDGRPVYVTVPENEAA